VPLEGHAGDAIHAAGNDTLRDDRVVGGNLLHEQKRYLDPNGALNTGIGQQRTDAALFSVSRTPRSMIRFDDLAGPPSGVIIPYFSDAVVLSTATACQLAVRRYAIHERQS